MNVIITISLIILYIIGWAVSYIMFSRLVYKIVEGVGGWQNSDRVFCGIMSLLSWIGVAAWTGWILLALIVRAFKILPQSLTKPIKKILILLDPKEVRQKAQEQEQQQRQIESLEKSLKG